MERSVASLAFKGTITEAIMESKRQKKLFVVYISGEDEVSGRMENTTWIDEKVVESVLKYCILLHLPQGSTEAIQFLAIYPQASVPSTTVIGYNGVQIWQNGGFVTSETLQSTIEKAWLSLHLQETTASILTAALVSKKYEPSSSSTPVDGNREVAGIVKEEPTPDPVVADKELRNKSTEEKSSGSVDTSQAHDTVHVPLSPTLEKVEEPLIIEGANPSHCSEEVHVSSGHKKNVTRSDIASGCEGTSSNVLREQSEPNSTDDAKTEGSKKISMPESNDVSLNIRLPNGTSLQQKFHMTGTLREVKAYVNENQASSIGSYNLAIPYPRRVFTDQDLSLSLSELGLSNRQALIVVPHRLASGEPRVVNFAREQTDNTAAASSNSSNEGYFSYLRRTLSYFNPFSYIGGRPISSNSETPSESSMWQSGANPGHQANANIRGPGSPYARYSQGQNQNKPEASNSNRKNKQPTNTRFGSNIHTLKHDEDGDKFENRNPFWNGNSTQYNGNSGDNEDRK